MKKILGIAISLAALFIFVGCEEAVAPEAPLVTAEAISNGATLRLTWTEDATADGYIIYADGVIIDTVTTASYDATIPAAVYAVSAYAGDLESATDEIDCAPVVTSNLTVYGNSDPVAAHHSGLGFNASGTAITLAISDSTNWPDIEFYFNDTDPYQGSIELISPDEHTPVYNTHENAGKDASNTNFDSVTIADAPGTSYLTKQELVNNAVYYFWIDPEASGWDATNDHFGKMKVESLTGSTAPFTLVIKVAYQPVAGLRWLVTQ